MLPSWISSKLGLFKLFKTTPRGSSGEKKGSMVNVSTYCNWMLSDLHNSILMRKIGPKVIEQVIYNQVKRELPKNQKDRPDYY